VAIIGPDERIERSTLGETILERLTTKINSGEFPLGSRLPPERELAARFGVARGPVREALRALALAGLVDIQPGRGTFVCKPLPATPPDEPLAQVFSDQARALRHIYHARKVIETELLVLATGRLQPEDFTKLEDALNRMRQIEREDGDRQQFARAHHVFDSIVAEAADNGALLYMFRKLHAWEHEAHQQMLRLPGSMHNAIVQHEKLLAALRSRDQEAVRRAAHEHFEAADHIIDTTGLAS
jgi:DNA-binding FadR family transcriptional regulator